jgi:hypothetical protein
MATTRRKAAPVNVSQLHPELQRLVKEFGATRVQIVNANTVIVWNSEGARKRLSRRVK